jgi:simple sugar transport system permease protein
MDNFLDPAFFISVIRLATPLVLASLGGLFAERSGIVQLALEGLMLMGSFVAAVVTLKLQDPWLGFIAAGFVCGLLGILQWVFSDKLKANQIVLGTGINILAFGLVAVLCKALFGSTAGTPAIDLQFRFTSEPLYIMVVIFVLIAVWFNYFRSGLWLQFCGENPSILDSAGISSSKFRMKMMFLSGALAGFAGASLSIFLSSSYSNQITAGRGFIALAALIFGGWKPVETFFACLLFAVADAVQIQLQGHSSWIPVQFIQITPYVLTIVAIAIVGQHSNAPKSLGRV